MISHQLFICIFGVFFLKQHSDRPNECEAKICKCSRGRNYESPEEIHKYAFIYCHYCGSHGVHRGCNLGKIFLCEECSTIRHDTTENEVIDLMAQPAQPITNNRRSIYNNRIRDDRRKDNNIAVIELSDSDDDYIATYSETTVESKTVSVTRTTVCYPLRNCTVQIPRIDVTELENVSTKPDDRVVDISDDSALTEDVSMDNSNQDGDNVVLGDSYSDDEVVAVEKNNSSLFSSESDEETKTADESERSSSPIGINYSNNSDSFDVNDNAKKVFSSNMISFSYKDLKTETRSESSGIESISSFRMSSESSSSDDIRTPNQSPERKVDPYKVDRISESSDSSITSTSSSASISSSLSISNSLKSISSRTASTISLSIQPKETPDSEQSTASEVGSLSNQLNSYAVKEEKVTIKTELNDSASSNFGSSSSPINKRKRRSIKHYFTEASSSDDDVIEIKPPKRKVAKRSPKPKPMPARESNQRSISEIFIKLNSSF